MKLSDQSYETRYLCIFLVFLHHFLWFYSWKQALKKWFSILKNCKGMLKVRSFKRILDKVQQNVTYFAMCAHPLISASCHWTSCLSLIFHFDYFRTYLVIILKALVKMLFFQNLGLKVYPLKILSRIYTSAK